MLVPERKDSDLFNLLEELCMRIKISQVIWLPFLFVVQNSFILNVAAAAERYVSDKLSRDHKQIKYVIKPFPQKLKTLSSPHAPAPATHRAKTTKEALVFSLNWSGYSAVTDLNNPACNSVTFAYASWVVPKVTPASKDTYSATWVGIDGYTSKTVEQIGTEHDYISGQEQYYAWFAVYPKAAFKIVGFPVSPGDVMSASVEYLGNNVFKMIIQNNTQMVAVIIPTQYTVLTNTQRSSADFIVEAPASSKKILPLTNFTTEYMFGCGATINGISSLLNNCSWKNVAIEMVNRNGVTKAEPSLIIQGNDAFFVTWKHL